MINPNQFDIVTLSKTSLCNNKYLLDHIKIPRYNFLYKNREQKCDGEVGSYLNEELDFKIHSIFNRLYTIIEQLWLDIKGKNKKIIYFSRNNLIL